VASPAAGAEHIFSLDGLVQSKLCSQLSNDKESNWSSFHNNANT